MNIQAKEVIEEIVGILLLTLFYWGLNKLFHFSNKKRILQLSEYKPGNRIRVIDPHYKDYNLPIMRVSWVSDKFIHCNDVDTPMGESVIPYYFGVTQIEKIK